LRQQYGCQTWQMSEKYFCYVYRRPETGKVLYVGYATDASRAYTDGHNERVAHFVGSGQAYEISISGPYRDEEEARNVEAALVSILNPEFNKINQPGVKFRPLGVPQDCATRRTEPVLNAHEIGRMMGGCIIVFCNLTSQLKSGQLKVGPTSFSDEVILENIKGHWAVKKFIASWSSNPDSSPKYLIAVQGPLKDRIVIASVGIDALGWSKTPSAPWDPHLYEVPLRSDGDLDAKSLRGRRVDIKFGAGTVNCTMVIDETGLVLHGYRLVGRRD